jgi:hypothetical protein
MKSQNVVANAESTPMSVSRSDIAERETSNSAPTPKQIRERAFEIHIERGGIHGCNLDDWMQAERELQEKFKDREMEARNQR